MSKTFVGIDFGKAPSGTWAVKLEGPNQDRMRLRLANIEPGARARIFQTAAKILGQCPPPTGSGGQVIGLALGKVQSGKTSSFITLAAQAFDNGYRVVIVLAGTKNNLLQQNHDRIRSELAEGKEVIVSTTMRGSSDILRPDDLIQLIRVGRSVVITVLKHHSHLKRVEKLFRHPDMTRIPVLIVDDEGDQASLNANRRRKRAKADNKNSKPTATNAAIVHLRATLKHHAYIAYTATPQANLLIDTLDELSPEFCVLVEPGPGYTGGSTFHGDDQDLYVRDVIVDESGDTSETPLTPESQESLEDALATFFIGAAIRHLRGDINSPHSMLVHTSHRQSDHGAVWSLVNGLVNDWRNQLKLPDGDPAKIALLLQMKKDYEDLGITVEKLEKWPTIVEQLRSELDDCKVWEVNSSDRGQIPNPENMHFTNNVFIGGNMLDRGVTVPGLAVTYITRWSKENQADTVEQRARWFGYKEAYLDVCRIWAPRPVLNGFAALLGHEDDLWMSLHRWEETNQSVKDWPRLLLLNDETLVPTRGTVASYSIVKPGGWLIQLRPSAEKDDAKTNMEVVTKFFEHIQAVDRPFDRQTHKVATEVSRILIEEKLLKPLRQVDKSWSGPTLSECFHRWATKMSLSHMDVIWVERDQKGRIRRRRFDKEEKAIPGLLQGYQNNYMGDRQLLSTPHIQVHTPMLTNEDEKDMYQVVLLAIHLPNAEKSDLRLVLGHV